MHNRLKPCCLLFVALITILVFSCDPLAPQPLTHTIYSSPDLDGSVSWIGNDLEGHPVYAFSAADNSVSIGDFDNDVGYTQAFISFDVSEIPAGAIISSALLRVYQTADSSGASYGNLNLGPVFVDNVHYLALAANEELFYASTTGSDIGSGPLATSYAAESWHELSVLDSAKEEFAHYHNGSIQFRLYHDTGNDNDLEEDTDGWAMGEDPSHRPQLIITYTL